MQVNRNDKNPHQSSAPSRWIIHAVLGVTIAVSAYLAGMHLVGGSLATSAMRLVEAGGCCFVATAAAVLSIVWFKRLME